MRNTILFCNWTHRKCYWSGCAEVAILICQQIFSILALVIFLVKKIFQNRLFLVLASRSGCGAAISDAVARSTFAFCNSASADRIVMATSRLLGAAAACVILYFVQLDLLNRIGVAASRLRQ